MLVASPAVLLIFSALLHAMWNATIKVSKDKDVFVFLTIFFSCFLVAAALIFQEGKFVLGERNGLFFGVLAGLFEGGYLISMAKGFQRASLAKAYSIMRGGAMVLVWVVSLFLTLERFQVVSLLGSAIVLVGIFVSGNQTSEKNTVQEELVWPILGALFIAGYHLCYGHSLKYGAEPKALFLTALITSLPFIYFPGRDKFIARATAQLRDNSKALVISSICASLGFIIFLYGLRMSGPGYAITLRNTSIFFSIGFSFLIKDRITRLQVIGAVVIGVGALIVSLGGNL